MEPMASEEMNGADITGNLKCCADCKTTKTPLWRVGPTGPKSLCNACGIKYRKKKATTVGASEKKRDRPSTVRVSLALLGNDLMLQTSAAVGKKQRCHRKRKLREEELAAVSLMALSCSSVVFA